MGLHRVRAWFGGPGLRDKALLPGVLYGPETCVPDLTIERLPEALHWVMHEEPACLSRLIKGKRRMKSQETQAQRWFLS